MAVRPGPHPLGLPFGAPRGNVCLNFVDNWFFLFHPNTLPASSTAASVYARIEAIFARLHIPPHEEMVGASFKGLGWM